MTVTCSECGRTVPVAPGYFNVAVPHVCAGIPCDGNDKREWRDALVPPATRLAQQHVILEDNAYWEGL